MPGITVGKDGKPVKTLHKFIEDSVCEEVKSAASYTESVESADRMKRWDRYYGRPLGNEKKRYESWFLVPWKS